MKHIEYKYELSKDKKGLIAYCFNYGKQGYNGFKYHIHSTDFSEIENEIHNWLLIESCPTVKIKPRSKNIKSAEFVEMSEDDIIKNFELKK